jgi:pyrimidine deaminase RibD-like protein
MTELVVKTSSVLYTRKKYSIHAEQACINSVRNKQLIKHATLYLIRLSPCSKIVSSAPCDMCSNIIVKYKVRKVICFE